MLKAASLPYFFMSCALISQQLQAARVSDLEAKDEEHRAALTSLAAQHDQALRTAVEEAIEQAKSEAAVAAAEAASEADANTKAAVDAAVEKAIAAAEVSTNQDLIAGKAASTSGEVSSEPAVFTTPAPNEASAKQELAKENAENQAAAASATVAVESARAAALESDVVKLRSELKAYAEVSHFVCIVVARTPFFALALFGMMLCAFTQ
jgi:colicin import membrane protein